MNEKMTPPEWGKDAVSHYLDTCRANQLATFANKRSEMIDLVAIDTMFRKLLVDALNPNPLQSMDFILRSHSAYLTAVNAVMSGQLHELHPLLRACLEQASYGHFLSNQTRWERWMQRHDLSSRSQKDKWRKEFSHGNVARNLRETRPDLGDTYNDLYERTIDYGAHPNERGASMSSDILDLPDGGKKLLTIYLHSGGLMQDFCLRATAQVGLCVLCVAQLIYPSRMQAVGIQHQLDDMCKRY